MKIRTYEKEELNIKLKTFKIVFKDDFYPDNIYKENLNLLIVNDEWFMPLIYNYEREELSCSLYTRVDTFNVLNQIGNPINWFKLKELNKFTVQFDDVQGNLIYIQFLLKYTDKEFELLSYEVL